VSYIDLSVEARYPHQIWELEVPLRVKRFASPEDLDGLVRDFHASHQEVFAISDPTSPIEIVGWRASARCVLRRAGIGTVLGRPAPDVRPVRKVYFAGAGEVDADVRWLDELTPGVMVPGPAIVESSFTTVVIDPGATAERMETGSLSIRPGAPASAWDAPAHLAVEEQST
jgi:N-methylhydantoinase A